MKWLKWPKWWPYENTDNMNTIAVNLIFLLSGLVIFGTVVYWIITAKLFSRAN